MKFPKLKAPRLLPVVIFATVALLLFKGVGLVTNGSYILTGTQAVVAAEGGDAPAADASAPAAEPTMTDSSPTLADTAPTVGAAAPAGHGAEGAPAKAEGGKPEDGKTEASKPEAGAAAEGAPAAAADAGGAKPDGAAPAAGDSHAPAATASVTCPAAGASTTTAPEGDASGHGAAPAAPQTMPSADCANPLADAVAMTVNDEGRKVPLAGANGVSATQDIILQRLGERRAELDKREADLGMREAIVAAAEKQMAERADALKALQAQIATLSQEKQTMEGDQLSGVVKMYSTMKPQEAASIFDGLDMGVLFNVAKSMDPRKMSPILAKMSAARAQELTIRLAAAETQAASGQPAAMTAAADPNALPQIVGH